MTAVLILGLLINAIALPIAALRVLFLSRLIRSGQPAPDRIEGVTSRIGAAVKRQVVEVFGQKKLLKWSVPGAAHFFVFWAFVILATVYLEAYGSLLSLLFGADQLDWSIPVVGHPAAAAGDGPAAVNGLVMSSSDLPSALIPMSSSTTPPRIMIPAPTR